MQADRQKFISFGDQEQGGRTFEAPVELKLDLGIGGEAGAAHCAGNGSGNAVNRVASGTYDMGFADMAALMEFTANNPTAPGKPVAVMMVYNDTPAAVFSLKKSGIKTPADLNGKKLGAPVFDAGRRAYPIFAKANGLDAGKANWVSMDPPLREIRVRRGSNT